MAEEKDNPNTEKPPEAKTPPAPPKPATPSSPSTPTPPPPPASIADTGLHPDTLAQLLLKTLVGGEANAYWRIMGAKYRKTVLVDAWR